MFFLAGDLSITDCGGIEVLKVIKFIWSLLDIVFMTVPIGLILMVAFDFSKNVIAGKEDEMKKNLNIVIKRLIFCVALFLVPIIVDFVINLLASSEIDVITNFDDCIELAETEDLSQYDIDEDVNSEVDDSEEDSSEETTDTENDEESVDDNSSTHQSSSGVEHSGGGSGF